MKRLLLLLLTTAGVLAEPPYAPRGWRPTGAQFLLPQRTTRLQRVQPRVSFRPAHDFFQKLHKPVIFPKLLQPFEKPQVQFKLSPAQLEEFGRSPANYRTLPQEVYREPPPMLQQYKYTTIPEDLVQQNAQFNNFPRTRQEFRRPVSQFQPNFPQNHQFRPFVPQNPVIRTQQQFRTPANPVRFPNRNQGPRPFAPQTNLNVVQTQQRFVTPNRPKFNQQQMFANTMQQLATPQNQGFPNNLYPTGPQLPLNEDPNNFKRIPAALMSFPNQATQQELPRFEGPADFRRNPTELNSMGAFAAASRQPTMQSQMLPLTMNSNERGKAPENQLLPKMQAPHDFQESPNAWVTMSTSIQVRPADKHDASIPDLKPPSEQFLPNLQKAHRFNDNPSSASSSAGIELKEHGLYTPPPKVDKPTEKPPQQMTPPPRTERPTPKPTKKPPKATTTTPSPQSDEEFDEDEDDQDYPDDDERSVSVATAVANGHYYLLLPDGKLQKVSYKASNAGNDPKKGPYKADLVYQNVEPIKGPIYKFDGNALVRLN